MLNMSYQTKRELVERWQERYQQSGVQRKSLILSEFCGLTGHDRKHAIKLMTGRAGRRKRKAGRKREYGRDVERVLAEFWILTDQLCSKLLVEALPEWIPHYEQEYGELDCALRKKLLNISAASMDRLLAARRIKTERWRRKGPKPGTLIRSQIPLRTGPWEVEGPGYLEVDTVAHGGGSMAGDFCWSLNMTDISTGWTCTRGIWNCGQHGVVKAVRNVEAELPFALLGFDSDNGHEFINHHLKRYLTDRSPAILFTRSRPYRKNDNAYIEQKNWTHVRQLLGYDRLGHSELAPLLNELYTSAWNPLRNCFMPMMKLLSKERVGSRYRKKYDRPRTPYQRLLDSGKLSRQQTKDLKAWKANLNPLELKDRVEDSLKKLWATTRRLDEAIATRYRRVA
jgi:hypothetical protein